MPTELGQAALLCALVAALVKGTLPLWGTARGHGLAMRFGASAAQALALRHRARRPADAFEPDPDLPEASA